MNLPELLFALRVAAALSLLAFLGLIAWLLLQDLRLARQGAAADRERLAVLRVVESETVSQPIGAALTLLASTTIGRGQRSTILIDEAFVSTEHAEINRRDDRWWLRDLGSRNGTLLNDLPLHQTTILANGDLISIGSVVFRFELSIDSEAAAHASA